MEGFRLDDKAGKPAFPPTVMATVKALACELPAQRDDPLSRYSTAELARLIAAHIGAPPMNRSTIWRILDQDALKPTANCETDHLGFCWVLQGWPEITVDDSVILPR